MNFFLMLWCIAAVLFLGRFFFFSHFHPIIQPLPGVLLPMAGPYRTGYQLELE